MIDAGQAWDDGAEVTDDMQPGTQEGRRPVPV